LAALAVLFIICAPLPTLAAPLLYVSNGDNTISAVSADGTATTFAVGLNGPAGLAFDASGNLYVANSSSYGIGGNFTISKISPDGNTSTFFSSPQEGSLASPTALAFDAAGNLFVCNYSYPETISEITPTATTL